MKRSAVAFLHIGFWVCYVLIIAIILGVYVRNINESAQEARIENAFKNIFFFALMPSIISFYLYYFILFPSYLQQKKILLFIFYALLFSVGIAITGYIIHRDYIISGFVNDMDKKGNSTPLKVILFMTFISLISGTVGLVIKGFITWFDELKLKEELKQKNHETEMALIKAQLDPHFLFNTLNNIDVLILKNKTEASGYLNKLSDILRFMLYETKTNKILFSKEIEYIEKYIELQKIRTSNLNYVSFQVIGEPGTNIIAPMIFIPFIENAFKHTNNKKLENAITIRINIKDKMIQFICENKFDSNQTLKQENNGLGNELIQKRLKLLYPEKHTLEIITRHDFYSVSLSIDLTE